MSLQQQLAADLKDAMRERDERKRNTLRLTMAALHNAEIKSGEELDEAATLAVLAREARQRRESIEEFRKAGRQEMAEKEEAELQILSAYLPEAVSRDDIVEAARQLIEETDADGAKDIGKVMPVLMQQLRGRADGRVVNEVVRELLAGS